MAGAIFVANTTAEGLLASSSAKCLIRLIAPTCHAIKIKEWGVFFDGVSVTAEPVLVQLCLTDTSYGTYTSHTPTRRGDFKPLVCQTIAQTINTSSSSPTILGVLATREVHPQSGYQEKFAFGDEIVLCGATGSSGATISLIVTSPSSVNATAEIVFEE